MRLGADSVEAVARSVVGDPSATLAEWSVRRLGAGASEELGVAEGLQQIRGTVDTSTGSMPWSAVVKTLHHIDLEIGGLRPDVDDPHDVQYWRREADAFASGVLEDLGGGLAAPRPYRIEDLGDTIVMWMEAVEAEGDTPWTVQQYWIAARQLGAFNGRFADSFPEAANPWASRGRINDWVDVSGGGIALMQANRRTPLAKAWLSDRSVERIERLYAQRARLKRALEPLPETLCHHDAHRRNLLSVEGADGPRILAVDWAMAGRGRLGEDLAVFAGVPLQFLDVRVSDWVEFEAAVIDGYVSGLRTAGWSGDETKLRIGYKAALSLLMGVGAAGIWFSAMSDLEHLDFAERIIGHPVEDIAEQWAEMQPYLLDLGEEALLAAA